MAHLSRALFKGPERKTRAQKRDQLYPKLLKLALPFYGEPPYLLRTLDRGGDLPRTLFPHRLKNVSPNTNRD